MKHNKLLCIYLILMIGNLVETFKRTAFMRINNSESLIFIIKDFGLFFLFEKAKVRFFEIFTFLYFMEIKQVTLFA